MVKNFNPFVPIIDVDVASFDDALPDTDLVKFKTAITPVQDLNGYEAPWPAGGGKNILDVSGISGTQSGVTFTVNADGTVTVGGTFSSTVYRNITNSISLTAGQTYKVSGVYANKQLRIREYDSSDNLLTETMFSTTGDITINASTVKCDVYLIVTSLSTPNTLSLMVCLSSVTDPTTFAPYSNICPIQGWTGAEAAVVGNTDVAELDEDYVYRANDGQKISSNTYVNSGVLSITGNRGYIINISNAGSVNGIIFFDENMGFLSSIVEGITYPYYGIAPSGAAYMVAQTGGGSTPRRLNNVGTFTVNVGVTYSMDWTDAGTVYGGELNILTGELLKTYENIASYNGETITEPWISSMDVYTEGGTPTTGAQVVYKLATPELIELDPTEIKTLPEEGTNNIWVNTGKIIELYYPIDISYFRRYFMVNSGYILLDGGDIDLTSTDPQLIEGSWDRIVTAMETGKPIWAFNTKYGTGKPLSPVPVFAWYLSATSIVIVGATLHIIVSNTDYCVVQDVASA